MNCTQRALDLQKRKEQEKAGELFVENIQHLVDPIALKLAARSCTTYPKQDNK